MKITMILYYNFISDTRVQREATFLANKGFEIEIINCKNPSDNIKRNIYYNRRIKNSEIMQVQPKKHESVISLLKFWFLAFYHLLKKKIPPKVIHAHDLTGISTNNFIQNITSKS